MAVLLQPTFHGGKEAVALIGLFSGVFSAWAYLSVRTLGKLGEPDWRVVFWFTVIGSILCAAWQLSTSSFHALRLDNFWIRHRPHGRIAQLAMTSLHGNTLVVGALSYSTLVSERCWLSSSGRRLQPWRVGMAIIIASGVPRCGRRRRSRSRKPGLRADHLSKTLLR